MRVDKYPSRHMGNYIIWPSLTEIPQFVLLFCI